MVIDRNQEFELEKQNDTKEEIQVYKKIEFKDTTTKVTTGTLMYLLYNLFT